MYQCILNVPLWNDWSKVLYSQLHGSPVLKALSFKSLSLMSATTFAEFNQFGQNPKLRRLRAFWGKNLVFRWRKISYFKFNYIFPFVLLFISKFPKKYIHIYILIHINAIIRYCLYVQFSFSFQWNIISNSFIIQRYYVSEIRNNFHRTKPPPTPLPQKKPN